MDIISHSARENRAFLRQKTRFDGLFRAGNAARAFGAAYGFGKSAGTGQLGKRENASLLSSVAGNPQESSTANVSENFTDSCRLVIDFKRQIAKKWKN
jgi:hypothetical protein